MRTIIENKSAVYLLVSPFEFVLNSHLLPKLGNLEVRIKFHYCGLCGSDVSTVSGYRNNSFPISLGHEFVATIEEVGIDVPELNIGDVVISDLNYRCGRCNFCESGSGHLCVEGQQSDFSNRAFGQRSIINYRYLQKTPKREAHFRYCLAEPLSCVLHALEHAKLEPHESMLVVGAGSLGLCAAIALHSSKDKVEFLDNNLERLNKISKIFGFSIANKKTQSEYDLVLDLSGSIGGLQLALSKVKRGGRLVSMSHLDGKGSTDFLLKALTRNDIWFIVSYLNGDSNNLNLAAKMIDDIWDNRVAELINIEPIQKISQVFSTVGNSGNPKTVFDLSCIPSRR